MRRFSVVFILVVLGLAMSMPVFALDPRVMIGSGNDKWAYAKAHNEDDRLTFNFKLKVEVDDVDVIANLSAYTNRGNYFGGDEEIKGRYDDLSLKVSKGFRKSLNEHFSIHAKPSLGAVFAGDLGLDEIQNGNHRGKGIPEVHLPYEDVALVTPIIGLFGDVFFMFETRGVLVDLAAYAEVEYSPSYLLHFIAGFSWDICSISNDTLNVFLEYSDYRVLSNIKTQEHTYSNSNGLKFGFVLDSGLFSMEVLSGAETGYGIYSVDLMSLFRPKRFKAADYYVNEELMYFMGDVYCQTEVEYEFWNGLSIMLSNRFFAGNFTFSADSRTLGRLTSGILGLNYSFPDEWSKGWVSPFMSLMSGIGSYDVITINNTRMESRKTQSVRYVPVIVFAAGVEVFPLGMLVTDYTSYRLILSYSVFTIGSKYKDVAELAERNYLYTPDRIDTSVSIGISMAFDSQ